MSGGGCWRVLGPDLSYRYFLEVPRPPPPRVTDPRHVARRSCKMQTSEGNASAVPAEVTSVWCSTWTTQHLLVPTPRVCCSGTVTGGGHLSCVHRLHPAASLHPGRKDVNLGPESHPGGRTPGFGGFRLLVFILIIHSFILHICLFGFF